MENRHKRHETVGGFGMDAVVQNLTWDTSATSTHNNQTAPATSAIHAGLRSVAQSANRIATHVASHPTDLGAVVSAAKGLNTHFTELIDGAEGSVESDKRLHGAAAEMKKTTHWIGSNLSNGNVPVNNFGRVVGSFGDL